MALLSNKEPFDAGVKTFPGTWSVGVILRNLMIECSFACQKRGEKHKAALICRKNPQISGLEMTSRAIDSLPCPTSPHVRREVWLGTHTYWQVSAEGDGITTAAA